MDFKKNGFWIAIGSGVAIAVIVFGVLVFPQWAEEGTKKDAVKGSQGVQLQSIGATAPNEKWVASAKENDAALMAESKKLYQYFQASDAALEMFFDNKDQGKGFMMSRANDAISGWMKELRVKMPGEKAVPAEGKHLRGFNTDAQGIQGFEWISTESVADNDVEARKYWMRVFNIHKRMFEAMMSSEVKKFYRVQFSPLQAPVEFNQQMKERPITNDLGMYIPFALDCAILWRDIPKLLTTVLAYDETKPGPVFRLQRLRVERDPSFKPQAVIEEEISEEEYNEASWKPKQEPQEEPVRALLLLEAYNFNFPEERLR
jgi:hypothetical protein